MLFEDSSYSFRVAVSREAVAQMFGLCREFRHCETGGILIGSYSIDLSLAHVEEATSPPKDSRFGKNWFLRGTDGLEELLRNRWDKESRAHYLGEWHFHTRNVPSPSPQDKKQMREVARSGQYDCAEPILLIVFPERTGRLSISCFVFPVGTSYRTLHILD